jgi:hypothetical protein
LKVVQLLQETKNKKKCKTKSQRKKFTNNKTRKKEKEAKKTFNVLHVEAQVEPFQIAIHSS